MRFQNEILTTESHALQRNHKQELEKPEKYYYVYLCSTHKCNYPKFAFNFDSGK